MMQIETEITKTTITLLLKEPFFGHFFTHVLKGVSNSTQTMQLTLLANQTVQFDFNPDWWTSLLNENLRYGALKHQILHLVLKHVFKTSLFGNKRLFGIAADIVVNQFLSREQIVPNTPQLNDFPELELKDNQTVEYYYAKLNDFLEQPNTKQSVSNDGDVDSGVTEEQANSLKSGESQTNNKETHAQNEDNSEETNSAKHSKSARTLQFYLQQPTDLLGNDWQSFEQLSSGELRVLDAQINEVLSECVRKRIYEHGDIPGHLREYLNDIIQSMTAQINWRRILKLFAESSARTYIKNTLKRPSKRYGTTPGIKIKPRHRILVGIDTSGSIEQEDLAKFFTEIYHLWKKGADIRVVECDCEVQNVYQYKGIVKDITGGGGTNFDPVIDYGNREYLADALFYFTDGHAAVPTVTPRFPIMWVITPQGIAANSPEWQQLPGRKIKL